MSNILLRERINQRLKGVLSAEKKFNFNYDSLEKKSECFTDETEVKVIESRMKGSRFNLQEDPFDNIETNPDKFERWKSHNTKRRKKSAVKKRFHVPKANEKMKNKKIMNSLRAKKSLDLFVKKGSFVNKKSLHYLKDKRARAPVEEILMNRGEIAKWKKNALKEKLMHNHSPQITDYAKNLKRQGSVFQRLYQDGKRRVHSSQRNTRSSNKRNNSHKKKPKNNFLMKKGGFDPLLLPTQDDELASLSNYFTSHLSRNIARNGAKSSERGKKKGYGSRKSKMFFERNMMWLQRKKVKLDEERDHKKYDEMRECTFHPIIHDYNKRQEDEIFGNEGLITKDEFKIIFGGKTFMLDEDKTDRLHEGGGLNKFFARNIEEFENSTSSAFTNKKLRDVIEDPGRSVKKQNSIEKLYHEILKDGLK